MSIHFYYKYHNSKIERCLKITVMACEVYRGYASLVRAEILIKVNILKYIIKVNILILNYVDGNLSIMSIR